MKKHLKTFTVMSIICSLIGSLKAEEVDTLAEDYFSKACQKSEGNDSIRSANSTLSRLILLSEIWMKMPQHLNNDETIAFFRLMDKGFLQKEFRLTPEEKKVFFGLIHTEFDRKFTSVSTKENL